MPRQVTRTRLAVLAGLALLIAALAVWLGPGARDNPAQANDNLILGIDTVVSGNQALSLGSTEPCRVVNRFDLFDVDIYVKGLNDLLSWETYIQYNPSILNISAPGDNTQGQNSRFLLQLAQPSPPGNNLWNTSESLPDTNQPGIYRVGAVDLVITSSNNSDPDPINHTHKDGVLLRLQVQALQTGSTTLRITPFQVDSIGTVGPFLKNGNGVNINDTNGDGIFDGTTINGTIIVGSGTCTDADGDGIADSQDNCPNTFNPSQSNFDGDSQGDACDSDDDNDGVADTSEQSGCQLDPDCDNDNVSDGPNDPDSAGPINAGPDNCTLVPNTTQTNTDGDSQGDACDPDDDNDNWLDGADNCPLVYNPSQANADGDAYGNACDDEDDGDGFLDVDEAALGTDSLSPCGDHMVPVPPNNYSYSQAWGGDLESTLFSSDKVDIQDLTSFIVPVRRLNTSPGDGGYHARWDVEPGPGLGSKDINISDLSFLFLFLKPDMFGGERAWNHAPCGS